MKKFPILFLLFCVLFPMCAKDASFDKILDKVAAEVCDDLDGRIKTIAVIDVHSEWWAVSDYIVDELGHYFMRELGAGNVVARDEFADALIQQELNYQYSGAVSDETMQGIGQFLGVDCVVYGEFTEISSGYQLIVKATQVETKKLLSSWKGKVGKKDAEVKFQIEKSKKSPRPKVEARNTVAQTATNSAKTSTLVATMIDENGKEISVLHPRDIIRFRVTSEKSAYLAILCIDANGEEEWLPLENNYIRAGESRIFPDIAGAVLRVEEGTYGNEQVIVYAANTERELPDQNSVMAIKSGTRKLSLTSGRGGNDTISETISYKVERK